MEFKATQIASLLGGTVEGNPDTIVNNLSKIENGQPNTLSFLSNLQYARYIYATDASIVIIPTGFVLEKEVKPTCTLIRVNDPRQSFSVLLDSYNKMKPVKTGIDAKSHISTTAIVGDNLYAGAFSYIGENSKIGNNVKLYPNVYIGDNTEIGEDTIIYPGVMINHDCKVGKDCILQSGVVIGGDGFRFVFNSENSYNKVQHIGNVIIEDHVEIGANTTIDRATFGSTIIRRGVKLDNLIQVGHNVEIGENTVIAAQSGVSASTKIGRNCIIGGQVGIVGHLTIADGVRIAAQSGIINNILQEGAAVQGAPAFAAGDYKRSYIHFKNLANLSDRIKMLENIFKEKKYMPLMKNKVSQM
jgi:UDP-3-O-[3-hydroxymyristoyl] glucosamine N-acyltransferase